MKRPKPDSQTGRILARLERGPICSFQFYYEPDFTHRLAARIYDLRSIYGVPIDTDRCRRHEHESAAVEYRLAWLR